MKIVGEMSWSFEAMSALFYSLREDFQLWRTSRPLRSLIQVAERPALERRACESASERWILIGGPLPARPTHAVS